MTKKIMEYDLKSISEDVLKEVNFPDGFNREEYELSDTLVVIEGKTDFIVSYGHEGVHSIFKNGETVECDIWRKEKKNENGSISIPMFPIGTTELPLDTIKKAKSKEIDLKDAVRIFGARLDTNYGLLLSSCKKIGVDTSEYDTDRGKARRG